MEWPSSTRWTGPMRRLVVPEPPSNGSDRRLTAGDAAGSRVLGLRETWCCQGNGMNKRPILGTWRGRLVLLLASIGFVVLPLGILRFGNPQWHSTIYRFQAYVAPKYSDGHIPPPNGFVGTWATWYRNGNRRTREEISPNDVCSQFTSWRNDGSLLMTAQTKNGLNDGIVVFWHPNGAKRSEGTCKGGQLWGKWSRWNEDGELESVEYWEGGKLSRRESVRKTNTK